MSAGSAGSSTYTERLSCSSAVMCSSPSRWRQRVNDERSKGASWRNTTSPQKYWKYGFSTHRSHSHLVGEIVHVLENEQPGHQPRRQRRLPRPHPTCRAEAPPQKIPIDCPREPHQGMTKIGSWLFPTANLAAEGIMKRPNPESQNARKPRRTPGFLAKSVTCSSTPADQSTASEFFTGD